MVLDAPCPELSHRQAHLTSACACRQVRAKFEILGVDYEDRDVSMSTEWLAELEVRIAGRLAKRRPLDTLRGKRQPLDTLPPCSDP